jgi:hypothetical protein
MHLKDSVQMRMEVMVATLECDHPQRKQSCAIHGKVVCRTCVWLPLRLRTVQTRKEACGDARYRGGRRVVGPLLEHTLDGVHTCNKMAAV